ncbi:MAG: DUF5658 family protein [Dehalococcoidales bacterium]|nr:DUF5658 family protein [Dehalococcoidales bacterium]
MNSLKSYFAGSYPIRIILGALVAAVVADGVITRFLVFNGLAYEGNPLLRYWVYQDTFLFLKLMGGLLAAMYLWSIHKRHPRLAIGFSSLCLSVFTGILIWNLLIAL